MKTLKRILAAVMVAVMVLTAAPLSGFVGLELPDFGALFSMKAEAEEMTEYVDGVFKYSVSNGGAIITGTVYEADFIKTYFGSIEIPSVIGGYPVVEIGHLAFKDFELATALTIPYGVKKIAQGAFYNWKHLRVLELPDSITYIDDMAFGNCSALEILHLPSNLVSLQAGAFKSTGNLKEVVVPKSLIESSFDMCVVGIGMGTVSPFSDSGLTRITFETGRKEIPLGLFNNCNKLTEVYIPDSVEIIGQAAFRDCYSLEKVTGMKNIREICELAFSNCSSLKDVPFLSNLEKLGSGAFYNASSLDEFCVPQSLTDCGIHYSVIGVGMKSRIGPFENSGLIEVSFEEGTDSVPDCIFKGCRRLQTVEIPDNITKIGVASFWECDALLKISGMKNVQEIGDLAFCDCSSLTRIQLPVSLSFLGAGSFAKTISLQTITIPNTLDEVNTYYSYVGIGSGKLYAFDESGLTAVFFQAGLKSIPDYLLSNNSNLKSVDIPKSIKDVGEGAFENCDFLSDVYYYGSEGDWTSVIIDDNNIALSTATIHYLDMEVTEETEYVEGIFTYIIEDGAVTIIGCDKSASGYIAIPSTIRGYKVNKIGANAFSDCYDITSIDMPDSVTTIEDGAFLNCTNMTSIKFSNSLEEIPRRAFFNCGKLKEAYIPDSVKTIGNDAFVYCGSLKVLSLGDNLVNIGMSAFSDCDSLVTVEIGIGLEKVAIGAFYSCDSLSDVYYAGSRVQWENISFRDLNSDLLNATIHYGSVGPDVPPAEDIITGKLAFATGSAWSGTEDYTYKYSDSFFNYDSSKYHHDLALMSMCLEASACVPDGAWKKDASGKMVRSGDDYSGKYPANAETLLNNIGFETWKPYGYNVQPGYDTVACTIASKNISDTDTVIAVAVRGAGYEAEWGGNFNMGKSSVNHEGFNKAKKGVLEYIEEFVNEYGNTFGENVKFWIVGYSRGAATANLVAAEFNKGVPSTYEKTKALSVTKDNIYCYTFETPQNTTDKNANSSAYNNIFSIVNPIDPVPKVAPSSEGFNFRRYGVTYYLPAAETVSNYNGKNGIKSQMSSVHRDIYGVDYKEDFVFSEIKISLLGDVSIKENKSIGQMTFMNNLIDIVATETLEDRENYYYNYQGAIQDLMAMFMGGYKTPDADALIDEIVKVFKDYWDNKDFISWHPINDLKKELATVISENTEVSYDDAYDFLGEVDSLLLTVLNHPNYAYTTSQIGKSLFYPHEGNVLVGWMAYLENLPVETRNKLLNTSLKYRTVKVNCPVDVNVYDSNGNLVASIVNEEVILVEGAYLSTYIDENGQKCIVMPFDEEYRIEVTAREDCAVTCSVTETDGETLQDEKVVNYYDLQVNKDETITCTAENADADGDEVRECLYPITDENGDVVSPDEEMFGDEIETFNVTVQSNIEGIYPIGGGEYNKGEFAQVTAVSVHGYVFDGWYCGDTLVTKENEYRFCVLEDVDLKAVYSEILVEPEIKGKVHSVSINDISMSYKDSATITPTIKVDSGVKYTVSYSSSNTGVASVDENGNVSTGKTGSATITVTVTDEYGNTVSDTCNVEVKYTWWQWIIVIVLFGWIWY